MAAIDYSTPISLAYLYNANSVRPNTAIHRHIDNMPTLIAMEDYSKNQMKNDVFRINIESSIAMYENGYPKKITYNIMNWVEQEKNDSLYSRLKNIFELRFNWDGEDAAAISAQTRYQIILFFRAISKSYIEKLDVADIVPTNYGTLVVDWYNTNNDILSVEIGKTKVGFFYNSSLNPETNTHYDAPFYGKLPLRLAEIMESFFL